MTAGTTAPGAGRTAPAPGGPARRRGPGAGQGAWPLLFVGPLVFGVAVFYLWPILRTAYFSFTEWGVFGGSTWVGFDNYARLVTDPELGRAALNTLAYTAIVLLGVPIALVLAALLNRPGLRGATLYRTLFFLPYVAMPVAVAQVWKIIYNGDYGILNWALGLVGIEGVYWVSTPGWSLVATAVLGLWLSLGFNIIILSAALRNVPRELYEAASLDGASPARQFLAITVPMVGRSVFFVTVVTVIGGLQLFDLLYALVGTANPVMRETKSLVYLFWEASFPSNEKGYGAAIAIAILVMTACVTAVQFLLQRKWVHDV
ncbi:carbohydrate ABC transporter permease [Actinokineospora fastidiosa]|uniref:Sugar ABC transporter permease n=1 Tax=Actinokineospora fastidiosa TaxID=1816 RepID=A0A918LJU5_9PSEU|nr:sugar ABC transporter permease [Actinokineospora fastidiosa]GGS58771.1 sugar ABC transporter permease [Actinokineospora fastidiosa]